MTDTIEYMGLTLPTTTITRTGPMEYVDEPEDLVADDDHDPESYQETADIRRKLFEERGIMNRRWWFLACAIRAARRQSNVKKLRNEYIRATKKMSPNDRSGTREYRMWMDARAPFVAALRENRARWQWYKQLNEDVDDELRELMNDFYDQEKAARKAKEQAARDKTEKERIARETRARNAAAAEQARKQAAKERAKSLKSETPEERHKRTQNHSQAEYFRFLVDECLEKDPYHIAVALALRFRQENEKPGDYATIKAKTEHEFDVFLYHEAGLHNDPAGRKARTKLIKMRRKVQGIPV